MKPTICLCMVVKNEAALLRETLKAVKPYIDSWSIVDTGSTDETKVIIQEELGDLDGKIHDLPWVDWATTRTESIRLARLTGGEDFIFLLDADERVSGELPKDLNTDIVYRAKIKFGNIEYNRPNILPTKFGWEYKGVTHEYLQIPDGIKGDVLAPMTLTTHPTRATKSKERCEDDAYLLEEALKTDPTNARYVFYLAQSYKDSGEHFKAMEMYQARIAMGGWIEEVYYSQLMVARLMIQLNYPEMDITEAFLRAYLCNTERGEAIGDLANYMQKRKHYALAYQFAKMAKNTLPSKQILFVDPSYADWRNKDEYAVACYWVGQFKESVLVNDDLLKSGKLPENERARIQNNMKFGLDRISVGTVA